jgi:hypothetical protein
MTTASIAISAIEPSMCTTALDSLSKTSALAAAVKKRANVASIAFGLWSVSKELKRMLDRMNGIAEGKIAVDDPVEPLTPIQVENLMDTLDMIARTIDYTHEAMRRVGLTNNSLTAGSLRNLLGHREGLLDLVDWIDAAQKVDETSAIFARANEEKELGQIVDLDQVR